MLRKLCSNYLSFPLVFHGTGTILSFVREITQIKQCQKSIILESSRKPANGLLHWKMTPIPLTCVIPFEHILLRFVVYKIYRKDINILLPKCYRWSASYCTIPFLHKLVGIPLTDLNPSYLCACLQPEPGFPTSYVVSNFCLCSVRGDWSFCWYWWNCWPSLFKLSFHNIKKAV